MTFRVAFFWGILWFLLFVFAGAVKSRPVGGEVCRVVRQGDCDCRCVETRTSTWGNLAYLYKRLFIRSLGPLELDIECQGCQTECSRYQKARCKNGKCLTKGCECYPCWKGQSCDQPANDNQPQFEQKSYDAQIPANIDDGSIVHSVGAFDEDKRKCAKDVPCPCANVIYSITNGNEAGLFSIEEHTGKIRVSKSLRLYAGHSFDLTVSVENEGERAGQRKESVNVHIDVAAIKERHRRSTGHHIVRRSLPTPSPSGVLVIKPEVQNNTFYKPGDSITFNLSLSHNQSASTFAPDTNLVVTCSSLFLDASSYLSNNGRPINGQSVSSGNFTFNVTSFSQNDSLSVRFQTTVKATIHPLANLYMVCDAVGTKSGAAYKIGPFSSSPSLYAVFPKVTLTRETEPSKTMFDIDATLQYVMTIIMPHLNFPLFVEVTSAINDFSFMPIHDVNVTSTGANIGEGTGGNLRPPVKYTKSSSDLTFYDSATLNFKNLTVSAESDIDNKIEIKWKVNLTDHPQLANGSKHWNGAGLSSGPNMLHVAQQAIYMKKVEPTLSCSLTPNNDTGAARFSIDDQLSFNFVCNHTNTSTADARNVALTCYSTDLSFVSASYTPPGGNVTQVSKKNDTMLNDITVPNMNQGTKITGDFVMKVRETMNPLVELDVYCQIAYQNTAGKQKMTTKHKATPPAIAAVPIISLNITNPLSCYKVGSEIEMEFKVLLRKMNTPLLVELIAPVNSSSPIMAITSVAPPIVGSKIENAVSLRNVNATCKSTVNDTLHDRCTLDFGNTKSIVGITNGPANEISIKFTVLLNDHPAITNGSKYWPAVGVRGGSRMMWIGETGVTVCMTADPKPILKLESKCYVPGSSQSCCEGTLKKGDPVQFNITISHDPKLSEQYADKVKILHMLPPYVTFSQLDFKSPIGLSHTVRNPGGVELKNPKELRFKDEMSFSYTATLDPRGQMPPGDVQATSVAEVTYFGHNTSTVLSRKTGICCAYKSPGSSQGKPVVESSPLEEYYKRGFLLIPTSKSLFVCSENTAKTSCFYTTDSGVTWVAMNEQVGRVIGNVVETLYAISQNKRAYMKQESRNQNWYAITVDEWNQVKNDAKKNLRKVSDDHANEGDPTILLTDSNNNGYGGNKNGIYFRSGASGNWVQKAMWKCCN